MKLNIGSILILLLLVMTTRAVDRYVSLDGTNDAAGGYTNWAGAATEIQWAVNASSAGDTVWVSNGNYNLTNQISITQNITVKSLNGINTAFVNGNYPAYTNRCFYMSAGVMDGFTISNGFLLTSGIGGGGGYFDGGTLNNCVVTGNMVVGVAHGGGGLYFRTGGMANNCTLAGNIASNCSAGGAFFYQTGTLYNCTVTGNMVVGSGQLGGGVSFESGGMVSNCTLANNSSYKGGGARLSGCSTVINCLVKGNIAYNGGGVYFETGGTANNCLLMGNSGGAYSFGAYMNAGGTLNNCTVVSNQGGVSLMHTNATVNNCIAWGATNGWNVWLYKAGTIRYTCSDPVQSGDGNIGADPLLVNTNTGNYRLTANSPCVNTGTNETWMTGAVDLDGRRRQDFFSHRVDMGCYEYIPNGTLFRIP